MLITVMIQAVYIISRTGVPIYFLEKEASEDDVTKVTLFSGVISAIRAALIEIDAGEANYLTTQTHEIYLEVTDSFAVAFVKDMKDEYDSKTMNHMISELITLIAFQFIELPEAGILKPEEEKQIEGIIIKLLAKWEDIMKESKASKLMKESLW